MDFLYSVALGAITESDAFHGVWCYCLPEYGFVELASALTIIGPFLLIFCLASLDAVVYPFFAV